MATAFLRHASPSRVRLWHREGRLGDSHDFSWSCTCGGEPSGTITVHKEQDGVVLIYQARSLLAIKWKSHRTAGADHMDDLPPGWPPSMIICPVRRDGRYCGQRVAVLYGAGELFACRRCYDLAYGASKKDRCSVTSASHRKFGYGSAATRTHSSLELPVSTIIMLRSIAAIARNEGENPSDPESALSCIQVFALGGRTGSADPSESGYFAVRAMLAKSVTEAARFIA